MAEYYFVGTVLPDLEIGKPSEITFADYLTLLNDNLKPRDYALTKVIRRLWDLMNLRSFWKGEELDPWGNLDKNQLEEAVLGGEGLPDYVHAYLEKHETKESRLNYFTELYAAFFREELKNVRGFLRQYLRFEREWRLVQTAMRAKKLGRDLYQELQFEDPDEDLVAQLLAQKDAKTFEPPEEFADFKPLIEEHYDQPLALYQAIAEYRFQKVQEMMGSDIFSVDRLLGYMVQLILIERWMELDKKKGSTIVESYLKERS